MATSADGLPTVACGSLQFLSHLRSPSFRGEQRIRELVAALAGGIEARPAWRPYPAPMASRHTLSPLLADHLHDLVLRIVDPRATVDDRCADQRLFSRIRKRTESESAISLAARGLPDRHLQAPGPQPPARDCRTQVSRECRGRLVRPNTHGSNKFRAKMYPVYVTA